MFKIFKKYKEKIMKNKTLTATEVAKHFDISARDINQILSILELIEKKDKWWLATDAGKGKGAKEIWNQKSKIKYVIWEESILEDKEIIKAIEEFKQNKKKPKRTTQAEKIKKGADYESYIAKYYQEQGYMIWEHGKEKGKKDGGIDLIIKKDNSVRFVQCKNWKEKSKYKINHKDLKAMRTEANDFLELNQSFIGYEIKIKYVISNDFFHKSAYKYIEEHSKDIEYEIIKMKK